MIWIHLPDWVTHWLWRPLLTLWVKLTHLTSWKSLMKRLSSKTAWSMVMKGVWKESDAVWVSRKLVVSPHFLTPTLSSARRNTVYLDASVVQLLSSEHCSEGWESHRWCASRPKPLAARCHVQREHVNTWRGCESFQRCYIRLESYSFSGDSFPFGANRINSFFLIFTLDIPKIATISWSNLN